MTARWANGRRTRRCRSRRASFLLPLPALRGERRRRPTAAVLPYLKNADAKHRLWVRGCLSENGESWTRGGSPSPGLLRNPTSPRIRLRQKAGFGGQERGEVK